MKRVLMLAVMLAACSGCVYQPIQIDVYVPTAVEVHDSNVEIDAHKESSDAR